MAKPSLAIGICGILLSPLLASGAPASALGPQTGSEVLGGLTWLGEFQVTNNAIDDDEAQLSIDGSTDIRILWRGQTGGNGSIMLARYDRWGQELQAPTPITSNISTYAAVGGPHGDWAGVDSRNRIHVVNEAGPNDIKYQQFDENGSGVVAPVNVGPSDWLQSWHPALAVGTDDTIHVVNGDYKFQCEDVVYSKLDNNGSAIWTTRVVSSDLASQTANGIIRTDRYSGSFAFTMGSDTGSWVARMNKFGVKDMPSVKFRNATDGKSADVATTPDGSMHIVWEDGGSLYYAMVNATGVKVVDAAMLETNGTVGPFPRVAAASDGSLMVVWEDNRSGSWQVWAGQLPRNGNLSAWSSYALTSSTGSAFDPVVAFDPDDQPVVAWTDTRGGDREIFFKRGAKCGMELYAEPLELSHLYFLHPNETRVTPLYLKNKGLLVDSYTIDLTYTPGAIAAGWGVSIDKTRVDDLASGAVTLINLTIKTPAAAKQGDNIEVHVNASSVTGGECYDVIDMPVYVRVVRGFNLATSASTMVGDNGETVSFSVIVRNTGDVREEFAPILVGPQWAPPGWAPTADKDNVSLDPGESEVFGVLVPIPPDPGVAPGWMDAPIGVTVRSAADATAASTIMLHVIVQALLMLEVNVTPSQSLVAPGGTAIFDVAVRNEGNLGEDVDIAVEASSPSLGGWTSMLSRDTVSLSGGTSTTLRLAVAVPPNALAGSAIGVNISALAVKFGVSASAVATVHVLPQCSVAAQPLGEGPVSEDGSRTFVVRTSIGNFDQNLTFVVARVSDGWAADLGGTGLSSSTVAVSAWGATDLTVRASPAATPLRGTYGLAVNVSSEECGAYEVPLTWDVAPTGMWTMTPEPGVVETWPGGTAAFGLRLENGANYPVVVGFPSVALPVAYEYSVRLGLADGSYAAAGLTDNLTVPAFSTQWFFVVVRVPAGAAGEAVQFRARAVVDGAALAIPLKILLGRPDLAVELLSVDPQDPIAGEPVVITVAVGNRGGAPSGPAILDFAADFLLEESRAVGALAPGESAVFAFAWTGDAGARVVRFSVRSANLSTEINTSNNAVEAHVTFIVGPGVPQPTDPGALVAFGLLAAAAAAAAVILLVPRRPRRGPPGSRNVRRNP